MKQKSFRQLLLEILALIEYRNDREKFVEEFERINYVEAVSVVIKRLPRDVQEELKKSEYAKEKVLKFVEEKQFEKELGKVANRSMVEFLKEMLPVLSVEQKKKISELIGSLQS